MIIDLKTHIYSLVAVFLALAIGILLGTALGSTLNREQKNIIIKLEKNFDQYLEEKKSLQLSIQQKNKEIELGKQFDREVLPYLVRDHILGHKIAIIKTNDLFRSSLTREITSALEIAGAKIVSITSFLPDFILTTPEQQNELALAFQISIPKDNLSFLNQEILKKISGELIAGDKKDKLIYLQEKNYIHLWGYYNQVVDTVLILGGAAEEGKNLVTKLDIPLINALKKHKITIVGGEPLQVPISYMSQYNHNGIITIDNIDTTSGQVAMIYALSKGIQRGSFGGKETARTLLPEL